MKLGWYMTLYLSFPPPIAFSWKPAMAQGSGSMALVWKKNWIPMAKFIVSRTTLLDFVGDSQWLHSCDPGLELQMVINETLQ